MVSEVYYIISILLDEWSILPSLIFLGVGAMTDFGPLIANPTEFPSWCGSSVWYFLQLTLCAILLRIQ